MADDRSEDTIELPVLRTYEDTELELSEEDAEYIDVELAKFIKLMRPRTGSTLVLNPRQYVFALALPSGAILRSEPRHPVRNVLLMLKYAYDLNLHLDRAPVRLDSLEGLLEFVARQFMGLVEERIAAGLFREYVDVEENLVPVRGRIMFAQDLRLNSVLRYRTYCRYSELRWDVPENQVIRHVVQLLLAHDFNEDLRTGLRGLDRLMDEVTPVRFLSSDLVRFSYTRHTQDYEAIHDLCRLIIDASSVSEQQGAYLFTGFAIDMNDLFERFVRGLLKEGLRDTYDVSKLTGASAPRMGRRFLQDGTTRWVLSLEPDLVFTQRAEVGGVGDCKFKLAPEGGDFYQLLSYCINMRTRRGLLLFPASELQDASSAESQFDDTLLYPTDVQVRRIPLNLMVSPDLFPDELRRVVETVRSWLTGDSLVSDDLRAS